MRPRIGYRKLAAVGVAAVVGVASTIALTSGSASAAPVFGYSGYAFGSQGQAEVENSDPQVVSIIACTTDSNRSSQNDLATANAYGHAVARSVSTETHAFNDGNGNGVTSSASSTDIKLGNLLTLTGAKTTTTSVYKNGHLSYTGSTTFAGVKIGGVPVPSLLKPAPNTKVAVPGLGYIVLNRVGGVKTNTGIYSYAQAVVLHSNVKNQYMPKGAEVAVLKTRAEITKPATAMVIGDGYGTKASVDKLVVSGPTAYQATCQGTEGKTIRNAMGALTVPSVGKIDRVYTTKNGYMNADKAAINFTSHIAGGKVGPLSFGAIESSASAWKTEDGKVGLNSSSSVASVRVGDKVYNVPTEPNTTLDIPGVAKLTFNQVVKQQRYIAVNALVIDVYSLNTKVVVGHSAAGVIG
jgi:hypothetical protein